MPLQGFSLGNANVSFWCFSRSLFICFAGACVATPVQNFLTAYVNSQTTWISFQNANFTPWRKLFCIQPIAASSPVPQDRLCNAMCWSTHHFPSPASKYSFPRMWWGGLTRLGMPDILPLIDLQQSMNWNDSAAVGEPSYFHSLHVTRVLLILFTVNISYAFTSYQTQDCCQKT